MLSINELIDVFDTRIRAFDFRLEEAGNGKSSEVLCCKLVALSVSLNSRQILSRRWIPSKAWVKLNAMNATEQQRVTSVRKKKGVVKENRYRRKAQISATGVLRNNVLNHLDSS